MIQRSLRITATILSLCSVINFALPAACSEIEDLQGLGVLPKGKFDSDKTITRADFVSWLVSANNVLRPDQKIKLASASSPPAFSDVPNTNPYFKWIQGMANAGWSVGYDDKTFKPNQALTREEMIAIKAPLDIGRDLSSEDRATISKWSDYTKIGKRYKGPMSWESSWDANWTRCFGATKSALPQNPVTREEAAACVWQIGFSDSRVNPTTLKKK